MKRIYQIVIALFFLGFILLVKAQAKGDHLEPVGSIYDIYDSQFEYYSKVRKVLFNGLTDSPEIRFQVMPSFTPENVMEIEFNRENSKYYLVYHICEKMIWENAKWNKVKIKKYKTEIDKESVELIKSLFDIAISQTKFPVVETLGADGANYYFSINKYGLKSGTVWSPADGTNMRKLIDIGYDLIKLAKSNGNLVKIDNDIKNNIEYLISKLKK